MRCCKCACEYKSDPSDAFTQWLCCDCREFAWNTLIKLKKLHDLLLIVGTHKKIADSRILVISSKLWQKYLQDKEYLNGRRRVDG